MDDRARLAKVRCWVEVSLDRIAANFRAIHEAAPGVTIMPVVKANAYGHGMIPVATALAAEGASWFAVSSFEEGVELREAGIRARILVMADTGFDSRAHAGLTPVIHSLDEIPDTPYHLKVDTGMRRLGAVATPEEIARRVRGTPLEGLMTHFASSADLVSPQTEAQLRAFRDVLEALDSRPDWIHAASSNPLHFGMRDAWFNLVRPGLSLYGYVSRPRGAAPSRLLNVRPTLEWKAKVLAVKDVAAGERIGYGGTYTAPRAMRIAVLGVGYADGLSRRLSNKARFTGAISMDVSTIDISEFPNVRPGDEVVLLGEHYDARDMARDAGVIAYSILAGIGARVKRIYRA
jgi:alanine racemase